MAISELGSAASQPLQTDRRPTASQSTSSQTGTDVAPEQPPVQSTSPDVQVTLSAEAQRLAINPQQQVPVIDESEAVQAEAATNSAEVPQAQTQRPSAGDTLGTNIDIQA